MKKFLLLISIFSIIFIAGCICETEWHCTEWSDCVNETQSRVCTDANDCSNQTSKPSGTQTCCIEDWTCDDWSLCSKEGTQTRTCTDQNSCGTADAKPEITQNCTSLECYEDSECTYDYYACRQECALLGYGGPDGTVYCKDNECNCNCADEVCNNDIDDDLDGFTDCDDFDCQDVCQECTTITRVGPIPCSFGYCSDGLNCTYDANTSACGCV